MYGVTQRSQRGRMAFSFLGLWVSHAGGAGGDQSLQHEGTWRSGRSFQI